MNSKPADERKKLNDKIINLRERLNIETENVRQLRDKIDLAEISENTNVETKTYDELSTEISELFSDEYRDFVKHCQDKNLYLDTELLQIVEAFIPVNELSALQKMHQEVQKVKDVIHKYEPFLEKSKNALLDIITVFKIKVKQEVERLEDSKPNANTKPSKQLEALQVAHTKLESLNLSEIKNTKNINKVLDCINTVSETGNSLTKEFQECGYPSKWERFLESFKKGLATIGNGIRSIFTSDKNNQWKISTAITEDAYKKAIRFTESPEIKKIKEEQIEQPGYSKLPDSKVPKQKT